MEELKQQKMDLKVSSDIVFQRIFGKVGNELITKGFLEAILKIKIKKITLDKNKRMQLDKLDSKTGRLDVKAELNDNTIVHIEMQSAEYDFIEKRIVFYNDEIYLETLAKGRDYNNLKKVITILITGYNLDITRNIPKYHTVWNYREKDYPQEMLTEDKEIHIIELEKFDSEKEHGEEANWVKFIKVKELKDMTKVELIDEKIRKAAEELEYLAGDPEMQAEYKARQKELRDTVSFLSYQKRKGLKEGREQGLRQGLKQGIKQGVKQGIKQGLKEGKNEGKKEGKKEEKKEIAKKLLEMKFSIEEISKITELTEAEIKAL